MNENGDNGRDRPAGGVRYEKAASSINVKDFKTDEDDFERWVELFEKAVKLATNVRDDATLHYLYDSWNNIPYYYLDQKKRTMFYKMV